MIRGACALAGVIALLLQGSSGGHMLLVEHTRCAEHGELVHGGDAHDHGDVAHVETHATALQAAPGEAAEEAHEHCALTVDRRDALVCIVAAQVSPSHAEPQQPIPFAGAVATTATRRFRIAPKNSPPA